MNKSAHISFDMLKEQFNVPLPVAADNLGLGTTAFKRVCRNNGVPKWPWRKVSLIILYFIQIIYFIFTIVDKSR